MRCNEKFKLDISDAKLQISYLNVCEWMEVTSKDIPSLPLVLCDLLVSERKPRCMKKKKLKTLLSQRDLHIRKKIILLEEEMVFWLSM